MLLAVICAGGLIAGTLGPVWPLGDSLAVGRLAAALGLAVAGLGLFVARRATWGAVALVIAVLATASGWATAPSPGARSILFYQKNIYFRGEQVADLAQDILASSADLITLQEVLAEDHPIMTAFADTHPHQAWCPFAGVGGTAVLSRWPIRAPVQCLRGATAAQIESPLGPLWVVSVHLSWPAPYGQVPHATRIAGDLGQLDGPMVMAGDFNMVAWAHSPRLMRRATQTRRIGGPIGTLPMAGKFGFPALEWPALPIDHVFVPEDWGAEITARPRLGSDHRGLLARLGPK